MSTIFYTDNPYEILGLNSDCSNSDIKKAYKKLALECHPDKQIDRSIKDDKQFKRIRQAYDVLSNVQSKSKLCTKNYEEFMKNSQDNAYNDTLEKAFQQLIQGKYPTLDISNKGVQPKEFEEIAKDFPERTFDDHKSSKRKSAASIIASNTDKIHCVESSRQKVYLDEQWRKITKTEQVVLHENGKRYRILTKKIQTPDGKCKTSQRITQL